ncbi:MAG: hypothetical protein H7A41_06075 [Chlamydiales bacterium]|nr:hypothetical protein [Chlamydiales bacterium]
MIKSLKSAFVINTIGLLVLFICLFGYQGIKSSTHSPLHLSVFIDECALKEQLREYSTEKLQDMLHAGKKLQKWNAMLEKTGTHVVDKVLKGGGIFSQMEHYPLDDVFDVETYSQYYYHAHRSGEHGHFHLFLRQGGMKEGIRPILYDDNKDPNAINTFAHLIAISMDDKGYPLSLFTTNRWVTGEDWYSSADLKKMIEKFDVKHTYPSYVVNRWLKAMLILFEPQILALIEARDDKIAEYRSGIPLKAILEDHALDVIAEEKISIATQIKVIEEILLERNGE